MASVDTSIYQLAGRGVKSVADYDAEYAQARRNKLADALNESKLDEYRRGVADENQLRALTRQSGGDINKLRDLTYGAGNYKQGLALDKSIGESRKLDTENKTATTALANARLKQSREFLDRVSTPEQYIQWHEGNHKDDVLGPMLAARGITSDTARASIAQALQEPGGFETLLKKSALGLDEFIKLNAPKTHMQDTGGASNIVSVPGLGGAPTVLSSTAKTQSPDSVASVGASIENNKRSVGASYANAAAVRATADATRDAARIKGNQDAEMKIGDDYRAQSKTFREVADAYRTINATLDKATTSAAATLAGATKFMKLLDPGSVVRESELGMALAASGVLDRAFNYHNTLKNGKVLTASQAADFKKITQQIYAAAQSGQKQIDDNYRKQAQTYGLRPEMIVQDLGQNAKGPVGLDELPTGGGKVVDFGSLK